MRYVLFSFYVIRIKIFDPVDDETRAKHPIDLH